MLVPSLRGESNNSLLFIYFLFEGVRNATELSVVSKKAHLQVKQHVCTYTLFHVSGG